MTSTALVLIASALLGYLLGSISGSLLLGRWQGVDIRTQGSGNAGGTNALRTRGWRFALAVVVIDIGKGALAAWLAMTLVNALALGIDPLVAGVSAGLAAFIGHVYPVFFGFRGGKGAGTAVGAVAVLAPWAILPMFGVWLLTVLATGYVGLATILAGLVLVPTLWWLGPEPVPMALVVFASAVAILIVFTHRSNLARLRDGTENRFEKARLLRRRR